MFYSFNEFINYTVNFTLTILLRTRAHVERLENISQKQSD